MELILRRARWWWWYARYWWLDTRGGRLAQLAVFGVSSLIATWAAGNLVVAAAAWVMEAIK